MPDAPDPIQEAAWVWQSLGGGRPCVTRATVTRLCPICLGDGYICFPPPNVPARKLHLVKWRRYRCRTCNGEGIRDVAV